MNNEDEAMITTDEDYERNHVKEATNGTIWAQYCRLICHVAIEISSAIYHPTVM